MFKVNNKDTGVFLGFFMQVTYASDKKITSEKANLRRQNNTISKT